MAANHLIKKKKKQPGYLKSAYAIGNFNERSDGFFMALKEHGMSANQSSVHLLTPSVTGAYADMLAILDRNEPLASCYFADNDLIAIGAIKALKKRGYNIPKDIAIIGFDNIPMSKIIEPTLTTIDVPKQYMGKLAAERLIARIQDPGLPPINIAVRTTLKERHSV